MSPGFLPAASSDATAATDRCAAWLEDQVDIGVGDQVGPATMVPALLASHCMAGCGNDRDLRERLHLLLETLLDVERVRVARVAKHLQDLALDRPVLLLDGMPERPRSRQCWQCLVRPLWRPARSRLRWCERQAPTVSPLLASFLASLLLSSPELEPCCVPATSWNGRTPEATKSKPSWRREYLRPVEATLLPSCQKPSSPLQLGQGRAIRVPTSE